MTRKDQRGKRSIVGKENPGLWKSIRLNNVGCSHGSVAGGTTDETIRESQLTKRSRQSTGSTGVATA